MKTNVKKGDKKKALSNLLIACLRTSPKWILKGYELIISVSKPEEKSVLPLFNTIPTIVNEVLVFRCFLADRALWEVLCEKIDHYYDYSETLLRQEGDVIMHSVFDGAIKTSSEFNELMGTQAKPLQFTKLYNDMMKKYGKIESFFDSESPKGTLLWEACKRIAVLMVGSPDFTLITYLMQIGLEDYISNKEIAYETYK